MSEINLSRNVRDALKAIDTDVLDELVGQNVFEQKFESFHRLGLARCGSYVALELRTLEQALIARDKARTSIKSVEIEDRIRTAGSSLASAVHQMKHRVETEEREEKLFYIDDQIFAPYHYSENLQVQVNFRWRSAIEDEWTYGSTTASHVMVLQPSYSFPTSKRKPGPAKRQQDRQDKLRREWEHLKKMVLHSVKDYFRAGGNGAAIPVTFKVTTDYRGDLNNRSAEFWLTTQ